MADHILIFGGSGSPRLTRKICEYLDVQPGAGEVLRFGPYVRGRQKVEATLAGAASHYRDGEVTDVELIAKYTSDTLACVVEVERGRSKVGGADEMVPLAVRTTSVFRLESGSWKLVHRHTRPITTPRPAASVISR
jgi:ketosteroid isomerase-like protein